MKIIHLYEYVEMRGCEGVRQNVQIFSKISEI